MFRFAFIPVAIPRFGVASSRRLIAAAILLLGVGVLRAEVAATPSDIRPLLEQYCFECHGEGIRKGKFDLEALLQGGKPAEENSHWLKAWKTVRHGFMPPAEADALPPDARQAITRWIAEQRLGVDFQNPDPGRVTMRRLNRMEYEFTVSDLFGTDFADDGKFRTDLTTSAARLRDMLPPDDTAFGFDKIGDFQTLSPALLEKYFNLAEFVVDRAIQINGPRPQERLLPTNAVQLEKNADTGTAIHRLPVQVPKAGRYRVATQFRMGGWHESKGTFEVELTAAGKSLAREVIETGGEKTYTMLGELELAPGEMVITYTTKAVTGDAKDPGAPLELRPKLWLIGPLEKDLVHSDSHRRIFLRSEVPTDRAERRVYAREIMERVAERAFRRPAPPAMLDRLADLTISAPKFESGVAQGLMAILVSPKFLFRTETQPQPDNPKSIHPLDDFALASRLSYLLWLSIPDEELHDLAALGTLRANLRQQVRRMLDDPKSARFFEDFTGQWLRTRNVLMTPISRVDGKIATLRGAMKRETDMLFEYISRNDRDLLELITANYTFTNEELARYYEIPAHKGEDFQRVDLPAGSKRGGILTHASFLVSTSNPNRTSPVKRGLFVLENLLGIEPPPPPPGVASLDDAKANGVTPRTVREQLALHRADKACAGCHAHFDPIGIALENYDLIARWRTEESGEPIAPDEITVTGQRLSGVEDLKKYFAENKVHFYRCITEKLLTYAVGRGLEPADSVVVDGITDRLLEDGGKFSTLLTGVIESTPFQMRRGDDGAQKSAPSVSVPPIPPPEKRKGMRRRFNNPEFEQRPRRETENTAPSPPRGNP